MDWNTFPESLGGKSENEGAVHVPKPQFARTPIKLLHDKNVTDGAKVLYAHMIWRFGRSHKNYEGRRSMAKFLGVTETTISNRIKELEAAGWVVVVERLRSGKNGNYQTPFYHVFLRLRDSEEFRAQYALKPGETMRPKPPHKERKSRKGIGGNPKFKAGSDTASTQVDGVNSSCSRAVNSSSHYLDAVDLDAVKDSVSPDAKRIQSYAEKNPHLSEAELDAQAKAIIASQVEEAKQRVKWNSDFEPMCQAVKETLGFGGETAKLYANMLRGTAKRKGYAEFNIPDGLFSDEFRIWSAYYEKVQRNGAAMTTTPEKLHGLITAWIDDGKPDVSANNGSFFAGLEEM